MEIICEMTGLLADEEFSIWSRLISLMEMRNIDFIRFHNCGTAQDSSIVIEQSMLKKQDLTVSIQ